MKIVAEYIWRDSLGSLRSKTKILICDETSIPLKVETYPTWNYDGSSTGQATTENSEVLLKPVKIYNNPLRNNSNNIFIFLQGTGLFLFVYGQRIYK